jgi:ABC-type Na+ transport system ATPase subunit NatA
MPHKFIAYKAVDAELISAMRSNQHEVYYATELDADTSEDSLCQKANEEQYILLTGDKGFAEDLYGNQRVKYGIMLVDVNEENVHAKAKVVLDAIDDNDSQLVGNFATVTKQKVRLKVIQRA